jgi:hypothetical protein
MKCKYYAFTAFEDRPPFEPFFCFNYILHWSAVTILSLHQTDQVRQHNARNAIWGCRLPYAQDLGHDYHFLLFLALLHRAKRHKLTPKLGFNVSFCPAFYLGVRAALSVFPFVAPLEAYGILARCV